MAGRIFGIIPAAGRSRRMGRDKQLIDLGGRPMLGIVIEAMIAGGMSAVYVVTRREILDALPDDVGASVIFVENDDPATEMIDSVRMGIEAIRHDGRLNANDGIAVCPGDFPGLRATDVRACIDAFGRADDRIVVPVNEGRRGHPIVVPVSLCDVVMSVACDGGLNALQALYPERFVEVEAASDGVVRDVDRPEDLG